MGRLQDFLLSEYEIESREAEVRIDPFPHPFLIKSISEAEHKAIRKSCQRTEADKRTRQRQLVTDSDVYVDRLIVACCVEPNFKDADLQARFGVRGAEALLNKLLDPGQHDKLYFAIQEHNHFDAMDDLVEEAKNSSAAGTESSPSPTPHYTDSSCCPES